MHDDVRRNPALLKLDLFCKGLRLDESMLGRLFTDSDLRARFEVTPDDELITYRSVNGNKAYINRGWLPQDVTYEGTIEVQVPSPFSYKVTQTIRRGETALERDELEGIITACAAR